MAHIYVDDALQDFYRQIINSIIKVCDLGGTQAYNDIKTDLLSLREALDGENMPTDYFPDGGEG